MVINYILVKNTWHKEIFYFNDIDVELLKFTSYNCNILSPIASKVSGLAVLKISSLEPKITLAIYFRNFTNNNSHYNKYL